jgi:hypothetical protein
MALRSREAFVERLESRRGHMAECRTADEQVTVCKCAPPNPVIGDSLRYTCE